MFRFTIRELILFTLIVAICAAWWLDRRKLVGVASAAERRAMLAQQKAAAIEIERANWEYMAQSGAVEHNKLLRAIIDQGLVPVSNKGKLSIEPYREIRPGFNPP